ncbi:MAG: PAS domain-containing protein, partial [Acidobacteria bacterium]|nr:PAS domain-containing protein [Acidobacteriota bacterium]
KVARPVAKLLEQLALTGDGVYAVDAQQRIILWNDAASSLLGYTPAEVLGKYCHEVIQGKSCDGKIVCQTHCSQIEQAKKFRWQSHQNWQTCSKSGEAVRIDVTTLSILSPRRGLSALVHIFRQIGPTTPAPDLRPGLEASSLGQPAADRENLPESPYPLSQRELEVLLLMAEGQSAKQIATHLFLSPKTVRNHADNILRKLQVHSRLAAVLWAVRRRLV